MDSEMKVIKYECAVRITYILNNNYQIVFMHGKLALAIHYSIQLDDCPIAWYRISVTASMWLCMYEYSSFTALSVSFKKLVMHWRIGQRIYLLWASRHRCYQFMLAQYSHSWSQLNCRWINMRINCSIVMLVSSHCALRWLAYLSKWQQFIISSSIIEIQIYWFLHNMRRNRAKKWTISKYCWWNIRMLSRVSLKWS